MRDDAQMQRLGLKVRLVVALLALQGGCVCLPNVDVSAAARAWGRSSHLYPAPVVLTEGDTLQQGSVDDQLISRGYKKTNAAAAPGEFDREKETLRIRAYQGYPGVSGVPSQPSIG